MSASHPIALKDYAGLPNIVQAFRYDGSEEAVAALLATCREVAAGKGVRYHDKVTRESDGSATMVMTDRSVARLLVGDWVVVRRGSDGVRHVVLAPPEAFRDFQSIDPSGATVADQIKGILSSGRPDAVALAAKLCEFMISEYRTDALDCRRALRATQEKLLKLAARVISQGVMAPSGYVVERFVVSELRKISAELGEALVDPSDRPEPVRTEPAESIPPAEPHPSDPDDPQRLGRT